MILKISLIIFYLKMAKRTADKRPKWQIIPPLVGGEMEKNMNTIKEMFPDWNMMSPGDWSKHGIIIPCKNRKIEIGLYREEIDPENEYSETFTFQIFSGDDVVVCEEVDMGPDPTTLTIDDRNGNIQNVRVYNPDGTYKDTEGFKNLPNMRTIFKRIPVYPEQKVELFHDKEKKWFCYEELGAGEACSFYVPRGASGDATLVIDGNRTLDILCERSSSNWAAGVIAELV